MKIVIFGLAKSGTTALFYKIKNSLPPDTVCLFEPRSFDPRAVKKKRIKSLLSHRANPTCSRRFYLSGHTIPRMSIAFPISKGLFKYEDMIDRRFGSLEKYLGMPLKGKASVAPELGRVTRPRATAAGGTGSRRKTLNTCVPLCNRF